jgi:hypothetical protein
MVDEKSNFDLESKLDKMQAKKLLVEFFRKNPANVVFSGHALKRMKARKLTTIDVMNVLRAGKIYGEAEFENGSWRYHVETIRITVVFAFETPEKIIIVSAWRKQ